MANQSRPGHKSLRKGRYSSSGHIYLITTATQKRQPLFQDWRVGRLVVAEFRHIQDTNMARSLAWVVMPDHFHWLVELTGDYSLAEVMRKVKGRSARKINQALNRKGQVWQASYHDHALRREEDLRNTARYIIANPVRAGLVTRVGDYPLWDAIWV